MRIQSSLKRASLPIIFLALSIMGASLVGSIKPVASAATGTYFDHIVIIAMENTPYASVFGSGTVASCPTSSAPFLCSMLPLSSTIPSMNNYGATPTDGNDFNGCSAACYVGLLAGYTYGVVDGYGSLTASNLVADRMAPAGLTWQAYCGSGCPRGNDHFPFTSFTDTSGSSNLFTSSSVSPSNLITAANSASPPNFLWYTPTDSENMHDVSVSTGDSYLQNFLVGSGSIATPAVGSLLASNDFTNPSFHTLLYLWWDECGGNNGSCDSNNDTPNLFYGSTVKKGYVSPDTTGMDEYASLWTIENNWGFSPLSQGDTAAKSAGYNFNDIFTSAGPQPLSGSFTFLPPAPIANSVVSFTATAVGGTAPYSYAWNFGDGSTGTGITTTHSYSSSGSYTATLTVTDAATGSSKSTQTIQVSPIPTLAASFSYTPSAPISGQSVSFSGTTSGGVSPYTYSWTFGDGGTGAGQNPTHTYASSGTYSAVLTVKDTIGTSATASHTIIVSAPGALTASFSMSPSSPISGQTVTFTGSATGGTSPYSYSWNLGGTTKTGNPVSQSFTNGTYTIMLTVTDSTAKTATSSQSLQVQSATSGGPVPVLVGWGGVRMDESVAGTSGTMSAVFPSEYASDMELLLMELKSKGYNLVRVDFDPYCTDTADFNYMSIYSQTNAQRAVAIAQYYGFWIILDYHGYSDVFGNTSCWLNYWKPIVQNIGPLYSNIIWEPENEPTTSCANSPSSCPTAPCSSDSACVTYLSSAYQQWINQARTLGDTHWIAVQNLCSYGCGLSDMSQGYPTVTDPLGTPTQGGRIFISLHSYMDYGQYANQWTNSTADSVAQQYYQAVIKGVANTGWPALNTEGGTDPLTSGAPDTILGSSAGYTVVTLHFIQALVNLYDNNRPQRIDWVWWPAGSWTSTPNSGTYGAMQCNSNPIGWGCLLTFKPPGPPPSDFTITSSSPAPVNQGTSATSTIAVTAQNGFTGTVSLTDNPPSGLTCSAISPNSLSTSGTATVSCNAAAGGTYTLSITGTSGTLTHTTTATFTVNQPDFTISASNPTAINAGQSSSTTITVGGLNGFTSTVTLTDNGPSGLTCGSITGNIVGSGTATISCSATTGGSYALTITGTSGSITHTATTIFNFQDFGIRASSPAPVAPGSSAISTITLVSLNGFTSTITITDSVPSGLSCSSPSPTSMSGSGTASLSCHANTQSVYTVTITGTSGQLTHSTTATFTFGLPPDFSIVATQPVTANVGSSASSTLTISILHGLTGTVSLTDIVPSGLNCGPISSTSFTTNGTATVSCSSTSASSYSLSITGTSGSITHSVTVAFSFQDFSISASPSRLSINTGASDTSTISLNLLNGFTSSVSLSVQGPSGMTAALSSSNISGSGTSTLTITPSNVGSYTIVVSGISGSLTHTTTITVTVGTQVSPVLSAPSTETVIQTSTISFTVTATDSSIPTPTLNLSASGVPSDASFYTVQGTSSVTGIFTWKPTANDAPGTYTIGFTVDDGVSTTQTYVVITVISSNVLPVITVSSHQNATIGNTLHFTIKGDDPTGTGGAVILTATGMTSNMVFDPSTGTFSFTPSPSQAGHTYLVNFTATDSNNPAQTRTESVPVHVQAAPSTSTGGTCLTCLFPTSMTTTAWLVAIGALVGIVASIALLHVRTSAELTRAKKRVRSLSTESESGRTYHRPTASRTIEQQVRRRQRSSQEESD